MQSSHDLLPPPTAFSWTMCLMQLKKKIYGEDNSQELDDNHYFVVGDAGATVNVSSFLKLQGTRQVC